MPTSPLDDPQQIQGNILRPFGGRHQAFLALSFSNDRAGARRWLTGAADRVAGTDDVPPKGPSRFNAGQSLLNVGLTANGLVVLHPETANRLAGYDAFWRGPLGPRLDDQGRVTTTPALLGDIGRSDPASWVVGGLGPSVDALLTIAAGDDETLVQAVRREENAAAAAGLKVLHLERGKVHRDDKDRRYDHFGFVDGLSQPGVQGFADDAGLPAASVVAPGEFILGCPGERRPATAAPRPAPAPWMRGGSFQVFRRLTQDAQGWWDKMESLRRPGETAEDVAARAVGRSLDGKPLADPAAPSGGNDFSFKNDPSGQTTPQFAHIRKVNPRDDEVFRDRGRKMLRRGIPFGPPFDRARPDRQERGMVFNSYVASIEDQFEAVQRSWAGNAEFPSSYLAKYGKIAAEPQRWDGFDPVLGPNPDEAAERLPAAVVDKIPKLAYGGFVTTTGAVYAFAPSLPALRRLAGDESLDD
ncbi:Dyp-type peroxidase [Actinoplanes solisilvae]|uniref:Dyp-type peroxidase n=1 Tax=Actinoplanes solisilvae TaxID=2486853 RepID=UPI000FDCA489|nr:Dyp-type peroxidase domain-containing protein [Actinoplanes solisilvae]